MSFYNVYDNPNPFSVKDGLTARNLDGLNVGNLSALNIGGLGAMFNIETAQSTIVQNTKTSSSSVLAYVFSASTGVAGNPLTTIPPVSTETIAATNLAGDAYQQLINDLRGCDSFRQLGNVYKNVIITLGITLVRVMLELNQVQGATAYLQSAAALSVIRRFNTDPSTGPLAPIQLVVIPAVDALITAIENRDKATATTLAAALPGIIATQFGLVIAALTVAPNLGAGTGGIGASAADQITFMGTLATLAASLTASTLAALVALAGQTFPSMF